MLASLGWKGGLQSLLFIDGALKVSKNLQWQEMTLPTVVKTPLPHQWGDAIRAATRRAFVEPHLPRASEVCILSPYLRRAHRQAAQHCSPVDHPHTGVESLPTSANLENRKM